MGSIATFGAFLVALLLWVPQKIWELLLSGLAAAINAMPAPAFAAQAAANIAALSGDVLWWTDLFCVPQGLSMVLAALVARFVLRRIPLIGG